MVAATAATAAVQGGLLHSGVGSEQYPSRRKRLSLGLDDCVLRLVWK